MKVTVERIELLANFGGLNFIMKESFTGNLQNKTPFVFRWRSVILFTIFDLVLCMEEDKIFPKYI